MTHSVLAYYFLTPIDNPILEVRRQIDFLQSLDFKGRIYISEMGINGQASGTKKAAACYMDWLRSDPRFSQVIFKIHDSFDHAFAKMSVKYRKQLVALDKDVDMSKQGERVSPTEWKEMLEKADSNTLVIDVRNDYEWQVGRFKGAELPKLSCFRDFVDYAKNLKKEKDPTKTQVMMYCTGGIRCEYFSCVMKEEGFSNVYQLDGGVIQYGLEEGSDFWEGNLFVFDDRLVIPVGKERNQPISQCSHCAQPSDLYRNCANMDCNELFLCCQGCAKKHEGCCQDACVQAPRVRPLAGVDTKPFRKWSSEEKLRLKNTSS